MNVKIFTHNIEGEALNQVYTLAKQEAFKDAKIRIMPDVHAGAGCVIGFTADLGDKVIPNVVGVDIGCGVLAVRLGKINIDLEKLDNVIKTKVPSGFNVHDTERTFDELVQLNCYNDLRNKSHILKSLGTLGGGNHFIEMAEDSKGIKYLLIHSGSRNLGTQVAKYYQTLAINSIETVPEEARQKVITELKEQGRQRDISKALKALTPANKVPKELAYLKGKDRANYIHDMKIAQRFAALNRRAMAKQILEGLNLNSSEIMNELNVIDSVHNYLGEDNIIRKGAVSAYLDEILVIPINMRDGTILARGKGNEDWNYSAPHGAGRIMSRRKAKDTLELETFKDDMKDIYTTTANINTIDESPRAYKDIDEIVENVNDTVEILGILKPIYNYKAT